MTEPEPSKSALHAETLERQEIIQLLSKVSRRRRTPFAIFNCCRFELTGGEREKTENERRMVTAATRQRAIPG